MRIVVTGGRDYGTSNLSRSIIYTTLDGYWSPEMALGVGDAKGVDTVAYLWYMEKSRKNRTPMNQYELTMYAAEWNKYKRGAGRKRNERMLDDFKPDLVVAFPGGEGTAHCVAAARSRGLEVHRYDTFGRATVLARDKDLFDE